MTKNIEDFQRRKDAKDGFAYFCKECAKIRRRQRKERYSKKRDAISEKMCSICNEIKTVNNFSKHATVSDGYRPECKACNSFRSKEIRNYKKNRVAITEKECKSCKVLKGINNFKEESFSKTGYSELCKECEIEKDKEIRLNSLQHSKEYNKKYRDKNYNILLNKQREFREKNREYVNARYREYFAYRMNNDIQFKTRYVIRRLCNTAIRNQKAKKLFKIENLIGISLAKVKLWLEMNFEEGMNWDNYGLNGWTIDHIEPCANFDLSDPEEQKKCMHWSNLTPMWHKDNNAKNNKNLNEYIDFLDDQSYKNLKLRYKINYD